MRIILDLQSGQSTSHIRGIGRYSLSLAEAVIRRAGAHEVWLALSAALSDRIPALRLSFDGLVPPERVFVFSVPGPLAEIDQANAWRARAAERVREHAIAGLRPDVVHLTSLFEGWTDDATTSVGLQETGVATAVTLYDLIPFRHQETHLRSPGHRDWYFRKLQSLMRADVLLAISEYSRQEAIDALGVPPERVVNVSAAAADHFRPMTVPEEEAAKLRSRYGIVHPFLLYTGNLEPHKNIEEAMRAYALLPPEVRRGHQFVIVSVLDDPHRKKLRQKARELGLGAEELILTGYVADQDLVALYNLCKAFLFPSLHEGFGLPALEAMACGAPTIGSNCTGVPEVIGRGDALFDPKCVREIAELTHRVLTDEPFRRSLREHGPRQAAKFTWDESARRALDAFEALHARSKGWTPLQDRPASCRRRLAFVSPLPPERSGIAAYSARLLPELAGHYEIDLIVDQKTVDHPWLTANFPIRDAAWFDANAHRFERILYHFGNSPFHKHMFALLARHPGVVMLHDFFLSSALNWMEGTGYAPGCFRGALYASHGYTALLAATRGDPHRAALAYPASKAVLDGALAVLVHSRFSARLAEQWYGEGIAGDWSTIPFLRPDAHPVSRADARRALGIDDREFLVCSFGMVAETKMSHRLLGAWLGSRLAEDRHCRLVFVGDNEGAAYGSRLIETVRSSRQGERISITGFVPSETYRSYLAAADVAVQLRTMSRGESSAAIFDCLGSGVPLVVNAHGSSSELSGDVAVILEDEFQDSALISALEGLRGDPERRKRLADAGSAYVSDRHSPKVVGTSYREAIEQAYSSGRVARYGALINALAGLAQTPPPDGNDLAATASAVARNLPGPGHRQMLVDVTEISRDDLRTGIERVTRAIVKALISDPPEGFRIEPVYRSAEGFRYARRFTLDLLGVGDLEMADEPVESRPGDIYLGAEWSPPGVKETKGWLAEMRLRGVAVHFLVFDLLPLQFPRYFPDYVEPACRDWLKGVSGVADGLICISRTVADQLGAWLERHPPDRQSALRIGYFHLGADIESSHPTSGLPPEGAQTLEALRGRPSFLMVGTVEPRKGHAQALSAFEGLWANGLDANLVIVGKEGWLVEKLARRLRAHREYGKRLFWLHDISDEYLLEVYRASAALLAASEGEGFGLPLIEAARNGLPIIARDIPVFREVAGSNAYYFSADQPEDLGRAVREWLVLHSQGKAPDVSAIRFLAWEEAAGQLLSALVGGAWYRGWAPPAVKQWALDNHLMLIHRARLLLVRTLLPAGEMILDLGGANAPLHRMGYPHRFRRLTMIDLPAEDRHEYYREIVVDQTSDKGQVVVHYGDMTSLGAFEDESVDLVWSGQSIEHVPEEAGARMCREAWRVLKKGGVFCLDTPNRLLTEIHTKPCGGGFIHPEHCIEYRPDQLRQILVDAGFVVDASLGVCEMPETAATGEFHYEDFILGRQISENIEGSYIQFYKCIKPAIHP